MLTTRQTELLRLLVAYYIESASSVSSAALVRRHSLSLSPATVRNELGELEEAGYVIRPHVSGGVVPTERGYHYYVETLAAEMNLPMPQQRTIRHQFHQVERDEERWVRLAAATLAHAAAALALVTPLQEAASRLRALEMVLLEERRALLVLVLQGGHLKRTTLHFSQPEAPDELERTARRLTASWAGRLRSEIAREALPESPLADQVREATLELMGQADAELAQEPYLYGFSQVLSQPEFAAGGPIRDLLQAAEEGRLVRAVRPQDLALGELRVIIGEEHIEGFLRPFGAVVTVYGGGEGQGTIAVLGPMRMAYAAAVPWVRYLARILTELAADETFPSARRKE